MVATPRSWREFVLHVSCIVVVALVVFAGSVAHRPEGASLVVVDDVAEAERQSYLDAKSQYEEMRARQKERCDEKLAEWEKERKDLEERVKPCCPMGCERELIHKDWLFQSQATYYKQHLKKVCGVRRPPDPDEKELKKFMAAVEDEEEEVW